MSENKNAKTPTDDGQVAHVYLFDKTGRPMVAWDNAKDIKLGDRLYVAPKQWVGLTDDEIDQGLLRSDYAFKTAEAWRAGVVFAMTKLKEKNHGA